MTIPNIATFDHGTYEFSSFLLSGGLVVPFIEFVQKKKAKTCQRADQKPKRRFDEYTVVIQPIEVEINHGKVNLDACNKVMLKYHIPATADKSSVFRKKYTQAYFWGCQVDLLKATCEEMDYPATESVLDHIFS